MRAETKNNILGRQKLVADVPALLVAGWLAGWSLNNYSTEAQRKEVRSSARSAGFRVEPFFRATTKALRPVK